MTTEEKKTLTEEYLGKFFTIKTDRPKGQTHKEDGRDLIYKLNYGHIEREDGKRGPDVYLLGIDEPTDEARAKVIGIIRRSGTEDDVLAAAPEGMVFDQVRIAQAIDFLERYHNSTVEPYYHKSCGAVVYRIINDRIQFLLLKGTRSNKWTFPKGHMEKGENEKRTALREVREEAGFTPELIDGFREELSYRISLYGEKKVVLFLAEYYGEVSINPNEIVEYCWAEKNKAKRMLCHGNFSRILDKAHTAIIRIKK